MNAVYADLRLLQNLFLPSVKLVRKERVGARVRRRYDAPRTPLDRLQRLSAADPAQLHRLLELARTLDPFASGAARRRRPGPRVSPRHVPAGTRHAGGESAGHRPADRLAAKIKTVPR